MPRVIGVPRLLLQISAVTAALTIIYLFLQAHRHGWYDAFFFDSADVRVYQAGAKELAAGRNVYEGILLWTNEGGLRGLPFTYPPFAAVAFLPMAWLAPYTAVYIMFAVNIVALCIVIGACMRSLGYRTDRQLAIFITLALITCYLMEPIRRTLGLGQINIVLLLLILVDLLLVPAKFRGVGLGIAAGIKLTPLLFVVYLLVNRQRRTAIIASATFLATVAIGFIAMPRPAWGFWSSQITETDRIGAVDIPDNQSINGIVSRILRWAHAGWAQRPGPDEGLQYAAPGWMWVPIAVVVVVVGLWVAVAAHRRGCELYALTVVGLTTALVSPVGWTHHWVWVLPAILVAMDWAYRTSRTDDRRDLLRWLVPAALLFVVSRGGFLGRMDPPHPFHWYHWGLYVLPNPGYSLIWLIFVIAGALTMRGTPGEPAGDPGTSGAGAKSGDVANAGAGAKSVAGTNPVAGAKSVAGANPGVASGDVESADPAVPIDAGRADS